ncbi:MAG: T9SS type A sorting domain-containing protein, partial [Bacteroidales bacterium]|nr:T9SS type A sorting domain-containing protein [Bacteroidales bacterium]
QLRIYDLNGRCVMDCPLGTVEAGEQTFTVNTDSMAKGMYLVNITISGRTAAAKMMVR